MYLKTEESRIQNPEDLPDRIKFLGWQQSLLQGK
jgi:hypothetical protein